MAYQGAFARFYDQLTSEIDYAGRARYFDALIRRHMTVTDETILLDLACGTGSLSTELSSLGYDVIGVDGSADMLMSASGKNTGLERPVLYLCQDFGALDLYGTVDATVCALDSLNHIIELEQLEDTFSRVSLFTVSGGLFIFDVNTIYKHREVLGNNTFVYDLEDVYCVWQNTTDETLKTEIALDFFTRHGAKYMRESERFYERGYTKEQLETALKRASFELIEILEGDLLTPPAKKAERAVYVARKI